VCVPVPLYVYVCVYVCTYYVCMCVCVSVPLYVYMYVYVCTYYVCMCVSCTLTHIHSLTHTHDTSRHSLMGIGAY
jgi:hypothetical protein